MGIQAGNFGIPAKADVARLARTGLGWSAGLMIGRYVISVASSAVLARLVSPTDYGLLGMVATLTVFIQVLSDFGLSWATVQRHQLTRNQVDTLFLVNTGVGVLLTVACLVAAPFVAAFYGRPELTKIVVGSSAALFLAAVAVQPNALMRRQMQLKEQSLCALYSYLASSALGIAAALLGLGYWALVIQLVCQQAVATTLSFPYSGYRPSIPRGVLDVNGLLVFGGYSTAYGLVNYLARNLDNVLIGRYWGATNLGYYSRAYFLMTLPAMFVGGMFAGVVIPSMAIFKREPSQMEFVYLRAVRMITMIGCPLAVGLLAAAPEFVGFVYGSKWGAVIPIVAWLSLACILQPIHNTAQWIYIVLERGRDMFFMGLIVAGSSVLAFVVGLSGGPVGVARSYAIANTLIALPILLLAHRAAGMALRKTLSECIPLLCCAFFMGVVVWLVGVEASTAGLGLRVRLAIKISVGIAVYLLALRQIGCAAYSDMLAELERFYRAGRSVCLPSGS